MKHQDVREQCCECSVTVEDLLNIEYISLVVNPCSVTRPPRPRSPMTGLAMTFDKNYNELLRDHPSLIPYRYVDLIIHTNDGTDMEFVLGALGGRYEGHFSTTGEKDALAILQIFQGDRVQGVTLFDHHGQHVIIQMKNPKREHEIDSISGISLQEHRQLIHMHYSRFPIKTVSVQVK